MRTKMIFIAFCILGFKCYGQKTQGLSDMFYTSMKKYADTTFVLQTHYQRVLGVPNYYILSKKDTLINIYYYGDLTKGIRMPKEIALKLKGLTLLDTNRVGVNVRFTPQSIKSSEAKNFWHQILALNPWGIDDSEAQQYCSDKSIKLYDGNLVSLVLITSTLIKKVEFYSPEFYEEKCSGNINRQTIIQIKRIFKDYFGFLY